jgi:outer membrane protein assembly factor BamB
VVAPAGLDSQSAGYIVVSSGYDVGAALIKVEQTGGKWSVSKVWKSRDLKSKMSSFVVRDQFIYGLDNGIMVCLSLQDGKKVWKRGRYGHGQMLLVDDLVLVQAESGQVILVEATPEEHRELAKLDALHDKTWNHAALAGNILVVRNDREAAAFELPVRGTPQN